MCSLFTAMCVSSSTCSWLSGPHVKDLLLSQDRILPMHNTVMNPLYNFYITVSFHSGLLSSGRNTNFSCLVFLGYSFALIMIFCLIIASLVHFTTPLLHSFFRYIHSFTYHLTATIQPIKSSV